MSVSERKVLDRFSLEPDQEEGCLGVLANQRNKFSEGFSSLGISLLRLLKKEKAALSVFFNYCVYKRWLESFPIGYTMVRKLAGRKRT